MASLFVSLYLMAPLVFSWPMRESVSSILIFLTSQKNCVLPVDLLPISLFLTAVAVVVVSLMIFRMVLFYMPRLYKKIKKFSESKYENQEFLTDGIIIGWLVAFMTLLIIFLLIIPFAYPWLSEFIPFESEALKSLPFSSQSLAFGFGFFVATTIAILLGLFKPDLLDRRLLPIILLLIISERLFPVKNELNIALIALVVILIFRQEISRFIKKLSSALYLKLEGPKETNVSFQFPTIKNFSDLSESLVELLQDPGDNPGDNDVIRYMANTPALGYLALPDYKWRELRDLILLRRENLRVICLEELDLKIWHNQFKNRVTKRGLIDDEAKEASEESERLINEINRGKSPEEEVRRRCFGRLPGYYIFTSGQRAIVAAPLFLPLPLGSRQDFLGQVPQMLGFDTDNPLLIMIVNSIFDIYYHKVFRKPLIYVRNEDMKDAAGIKMEDNDTKNNVHIYIKGHNINLACAHLKKKKNYSSTSQEFSLVTKKKKLENQINSSIQDLLKLQKYFPNDFSELEDLSKLNGQPRGDEDFKDRQYHYRLEIFEAIEERKTGNLKRER
jgi:hypothetical protein